MKPVIIIQARAGSKRFPGKVLAELVEKNVLYYVTRRCQLSKKQKDIVIATTKHKRDDPVAIYGNSLGVKIYRGSEDDVLKRFVEAAIMVKADPIIRICADSPIVDPHIIDECIDLYIKKNVDYLFIKGYPRGMGAEIVSFRALQQSLNETLPKDTFFREHVITYVVDHPEKFSLNIIEAPKKYQRPNFRLCVDEKKDLEVINHVCSHFYPRLDFTTQEVIDFLDKNSKIASINRDVKQKNEKY